MYQRKDSYFDRAKGEGYRSRAAYKLIDINRKFRIIKRGYRILDLGAAPGSWSQVCAKLGARVVAVDLNPISNIESVEIIAGDLLKSETLEKINGKFDVILSDMAPSTCGIKKLDQGRSAVLAEVSFDIAKKFLKKNGSFVVKVFEGAGTDKLFLDMKKAFEKVKKYRPSATRKESREVYYICRAKLS